jgi:hypothetical protein
MYVHYSTLGSESTGEGPRSYASLHGCQAEEEVRQYPTVYLHATI